MDLFDVNVLVYAHREDAPDHARYRRWLESAMGSGDPFGLSAQVLSGVLRVVTHPSVFNPPSPLEHAIGFVQSLRQHPSAVTIDAGPRHWDIFIRLCEVVRARGNLVPDAYFAALAIESGSRWITTDRDYSRFPGLKWRHPLDGRAAYPQDT